MTYGGAIFGDNGLLASADYPGYVKHESITAYTQMANNVKRFTTQVPYTAPNPPLVFIQPAYGVAAAVLAMYPPTTIINGMMEYIIDVLCDGVVSLITFREITGTSASGFGMAFFSAGHKLTFDTGQKMLTVRVLSTLTEGVTVPADGGAFFFNAFDLKTVTSDTYEYIACLSNTMVDKWYTQQLPATYSMISDTLYGAMVVKCYLKTGQYKYTISWTLSAYVRKTAWVSYRGCAYFMANGDVGFRWVQSGSGNYFHVVSWRIQATVQNGAANTDEAFNYGYAPPQEAYNALGGAIVSRDGTLSSSVFPYYSGVYGSNSQRLMVINYNFYA